MIWVFVLDTALFIFLSDLWFSEEYKVAFMYVGVVLISAWLPKPIETVAAAGICSMLTVSAPYLSDWPDILSFDTTNRGLAVILLWAIATANLSGERIGRAAERRVTSEAEFHERLLLTRARLREEWLRKEAAQHQIRLQEQAEASRLAAIVATQEREQRRVAKELHDGLGQNIALITMLIDTIEERVQQDDTLSLLRELRAEFIHMLNELRTLSHALYPVALEYLDLKTAMEEECARISEKSTMKVTFKCDELPTGLSKGVSTCVYRITQEALRNALVHGKAQKAQVTLSVLGDSLNWSVRDFGKGFDIDDPKRKGLGLLSMRERVDLLGGTFYLTSMRGTGTVVCVTVPISETGTSSTTPL